MENMISKAELDSAEQQSVARHLSFAAHAPAKVDMRKIHRLMRRGKIIVIRRPQ